jgi:hypothetical protein
MDIFYVTHPSFSSVTTKVQQSRTPTCRGPDMFTKCEHANAPRKRHPAAKPSPHRNRQRDTDADGTTSTKGKSLQPQPDPLATAVSHLLQQVLQPRLLQPHQGNSLGDLGQVDGWQSRLSTSEITFWSGSGLALGRNINKASV